MQTYDIALDGSNEERRSFSGRVLVLVEGTGVDVTLISRARGVREKAEARAKGFASLPLDAADAGDRFDEVVLDSTTAQTVTIGVSDRNPRIEGEVTTVTPQGTASFDSKDDGSIPATDTVTLPARSGRRAVLIYNLDGSIALRAAESGSGSATHGLPIPKGQMLTLETEAAITLYNPNGGAAGYAWAELY